MSGGTKITRAVIFLCTSPICLPSSEPPSTRTYISPDRSFEITIPPDYAVHTGKDKPQISYIPVCHEDSLVCISFPPDRYHGTNFEGAAVEITVLPATTETACLNPPHEDFHVDAETPSKIIDGAHFLHAFFGGAAMSHDLVRHEYLGYKNRKCYKLAVEVTFSNFEVHPPGTIKEFTKRDQEQVRAQLERIIDSFRSLH
ncbi:MAG: hypothetical protein JOY62_00200 [Acidobacteriaceae bacterium]|nr:hypothetical protein [Acidobacteriaceae bacterium]MBV9778364.1 hypothetical protein [Acidobacteriaceae bacterium]